MQTKLKTIFKLTFLTFLIGWTIFCLMVYFFPQMFFYHPSTVKPNIKDAVAAGFNAEEIVYTSSDGTNLYGWHQKAQSGYPTFVFFHGNSHDISSFYRKLIPLTSKGYGAFIGEYRGFGGINGRITQSNLEQDAHAAVKYLNSTGIPNNQIILYGMSLGSYMATDTAVVLGKETPFKALVLEVPFDSLLNVVKQRIVNIFPFDIIIKDKYDNTLKIQNLTIPALFMVAEQDKVVPPERAKALYAQTPSPKKLINYASSGHGDLAQQENWQDILNWISQYEKAE